MEKYLFENDLKVFGPVVKTFPEGIGEAFDTLIKQTGDCAGERNYYGISSMDSEGKMIYKAVAEEKYEAEAGKYNYEESIIEKGEYLFTALKEWQNKTHCIKDIFQEMLQEARIDKTKPAVEWYKNDDEMWCMIKSI